MLTQTPKIFSNRKRRQGSLGHQLMEILKAIFRPGVSRHKAKQRGDEAYWIHGISTMRKYTEEVFEMGRFFRERFGCCIPEDITPEMCEAFIQSKVEAGCAGGTLGRYQAVIRKLDHAMRHLGRRPKDAPWLLPTREQGGVQSFHANTSTLAYTQEEAEAILDFIKTKGSRKYGSTAALVVELMLATGLRISEACFLRADNIDLSRRVVCLDTNNNHSKGGKKRTTLPYNEKFDSLIAKLKSIGEQNPTRHIFVNRSSLPSRVQSEIWRACYELNIQPLGSHAFRKRNAQNYHEKLLGEGLDNTEARLEVSRHLGHNRLRVINESYVPPQDQS